MRSSGTVLRRGSDSYKSIDFEHGTIVKHDSGSEPSGTPINPNLQKAFTRQPTPFIEGVLKGAFNVFKTSLNNNLDNFNIQRCFITTQETI